MTKIPTSENNLIELSFEGECLQALQRFAHANDTGGKNQVEQDLKRIHGLTVKDDKLGKWSYTQINLDKNTQFPEKKLIEPDPDEFFFSRIKNLAEKFQEFILLNFHQGGIFYSARRFLEFHLNSLGFAPSTSDGSRHRIVCEFSPEQLVITEKFSVSKLKFLPEYDFKIVCNENGEMVPCILKKSELEKIAYFQNIIKNKLYGSNHNKLKMQLMDQENVVPCLGFNTEQHISLMEFTVKHTIKLESEFKEIRTKKLSKEDISFTVQSELFDLSSKTPFPEFSKLLTPDLQWASPRFFKKYGFKNQIYDLILEDYRDIILILLNIISKLFFSSLALSPPPKCYESQNDFSHRMRA